MNFLANVCWGFIEGVGRISRGQADDENQSQKQGCGETETCEAIRSSVTFETHCFEWISVQYVQQMLECSVDRMWVKCQYLNDLETD